MSLRQGLHHIITVSSAFLLSMTLASCGGDETQDIQDAINGPGGVWFGAFVETEQTDNPNDIDIGGMYLDIPSDIAGSVKGGMSYQVYDCQSRNDLEIDGLKTRERLQTTLARGDIDPRNSASDELDSPSQFMSIEITGGYQDNAAAPQPWGGSYDVNVFSNDTTRISNECNDQTYTQADNGVWSVYPDDAQFGIIADYDNSSNTLSWTALDDAQQTLIMQLDTSKISSSDSAFITQVVQTSDLSTFVPVVQSGAESTLVVQVFNQQRTLIGFDAITISHP